MESIGLKELRQHASDYVKRAEAGETMVVTVAGREAAILGPVARRQWSSYDAIAEVFETAGDSTLASDLADVPDSLRDPWGPR